MKNYEILYILPSTMTGKEIKSNFLEIEKEVENLGGKKLETLLDHPFLLKTEISKEEDSEELKGLPVIKRKLAYVIKKNRFGFYCLFNFSAEEKSIKEIDNYLRMNNNILRYIMLQIDPMNAENLKQLQKLFARKKAEQDKNEGKKDNVQEARRTTREERVIKVSEEKKRVEDPKAETLTKSKETKKEIIEEKEVKTKELKVKEEMAISKIKPPMKIEEKVEKKKEEPKEVVKEKETKKEKVESKDKTLDKKKKVRLEDLEEKLDEILEDTML
ncbi:MAG: 30S ribosomal protein S6 [Patescibacteria group bacterium]|nr:30S ribosomal protein S6 [Patescibacteria group bacterium]